jgi:hypothetical protein
MYVVIPSIIATGVFGAGFYISSVVDKRKRYSQPLQTSQYKRVTQYPVQSRATAINNSVIKREQEQLIVNRDLLGRELNELRLELAYKKETRRKALEEQKKQQQIANNAQTERKRIEATTLAQSSAREAERLKKEQEDKQRRIDELKKQQVVTTTPQGTVQANNSNARLQQVARRLDELRINKKRPAPVSTPQGTVQANNSKVRTNLQQVARRLEEFEVKPVSPIKVSQDKGQSNNSKVEKELRELEELINQKSRVPYETLIPKLNRYASNIGNVFIEIQTLTNDSLDWGVSGLKTRADGILNGTTENKNKIKLLSDRFNELFKTTKLNANDKTKNIEIMKSLLKNIEGLIKDIEFLIGVIELNEKEINQILADIKGIQKKQSSPMGKQQSPFQQASKSPFASQNGQSNTSKKELELNRLVDKETEILRLKKEIFDKGIGYYKSIIHNDELIDDSYKLLLTSELDEKINELSIDALRIKNDASIKLLEIEEEDKKIDALLDNIIKFNNSEIDIKIKEYQSLIKSIKEIVEAIKDIIGLLEKDEKEMIEIVTEVSKLISEKVSKRKPNIGAQGRAFKGSLSRSSSAASSMFQQEQPSPKGKQGSPFQQASKTPFSFQNGQTNNSSLINRLKESARNLVIQGNNHIQDINNKSFEINTLIVNKKFNKKNKIGIDSSLIDLASIMNTSETINRELNKKMEYINTLRSAEDINNAINETRNNVEILDDYNKEMDKILAKVKKLVETKQNNSNSSEKCAKLGGFIYDNKNSCYLDSILMALFHSKDKYIEKILLKNDIKDDNPDLLKLKKDIQEELNRLANVIYSEEKSSAQQLRKLFTDASELIKDKKRTSDLFAYNWTSHQRDPIDVYTLLEMLFEIKPELLIEEKKFDNANKDLPGKPKVRNSTESIFIKTYFEIEEKEPDKIYKISEMIPKHGVETDGISGKTGNGRLKGERIISITDVTYIKSPILGIITSRNSRSSGQKLMANIIPSLSLKLEGNTKYLILKSIIVHHGSASGGHYMAYIKCSDNWYFYNDMDFEDKGMVLVGTDQDIINNEDVIKNSHALFYFP